jgi:hypothetical protein
MIFGFEIVIYTDMHNMGRITNFFVKQGGLYEPYQIFAK